jgi:hypothetical protein
MIICHANSGQSKIDHFKFRVDLVQALLIEHGSEIERKVQGCHSTDKNVVHLFWKTLCQKNPTNREKGQANKEVCSVLQTEQKEGDGVLMP